MSELAQIFREATQRARAGEPACVYDQVHAATVRAQHADGTVDLEVDKQVGPDGTVRDPIGSITDVPLLVGMATARTLVDDGTRVRLAFLGGDPERPIAIGVDMAPDATRGVARVEDTTDDGFLRIITSQLTTSPLFLGPTKLAIQHYGPNGLPTSLLPTIVQLGVDEFHDVSISGRISSGSGKVLLK